MKRLLLLLLFLTACTTDIFAQRSLSISGTVADRHSGEPVPFVAVCLGDDEKLVITTQEGRFNITGIMTTSTTLRFECLGYETKVLDVNLSNGDVRDLRVKLSEANLELHEVTVTAQRKTQEGSTSFLIDRTALDNQQILNLSDWCTPAEQCIDGRNDQRKHPNHQPYQHRVGRSRDRHSFGRIW